VLGGAADVRQEIEIVFSEPVFNGAERHQPRVLASSRLPASEGGELKKNRHSVPGDSSSMHFWSSRGEWSSTNSTLNVLWGRPETLHQLMSEAFKSHELPGSCGVQ
jgi:hypothetical protein